MEILLPFQLLPNHLIESLFSFSKSQKKKNVSSIQKIIQKINTENFEDSQ